MVRKLNASKHLCRIDPAYIEVVSDDEVKSALPEVNSFMNIAPIITGNGPSPPWQDPQVSPEVHLVNPDHLSVADPIQMNLTHSSGLPGPQNMVGNIDPTPIVGLTQPKLLPVDFHALGPIYSFEEASKNKQQLDVTKS